MKTITGRIRKLEGRFRPGETVLLVMSCVWKDLALADDRCIQILRECGHLPTTAGFGINFCEIPEDLNAKELERYLRENGAETRG